MNTESELNQQLRDSRGTIAGSPNVLISGAVYDELSGRIYSLNIGVPGYITMNLTPYRPSSSGVPDIG